MSQPLPETNLEAVQLGQFREWLANPMTRMFFAQLRYDQIIGLREAALAAIQTGVGNAKEHNKLVLGAAIEKIIKKYDNTKSYPFTVKLSEAIAFQSDSAR